MSESLEKKTNGESESCQSGGGWLERLLPLLSVATLAFLFGMVIAIKQSPPFHTVRDAWLAFCCLYEQQGIIGEQFPDHMWYPSESAEGGLTKSLPGDSFGDYTVFTSGDSCRATLVDQQGEQVHEWYAPFWEVFPNSEHVPSWLPERFILMRRALVFPNGDLLALYETIANTPSGCGLAKLDAAGNVIWVYDDYAHHDVSIGQDGRIYVLVHELRRLTEEDKQLNPLTDLPLIEDYLVILSPEGKELQRVSLLDALVDSPYYRPMLIHVDRYGDITHNNTAAVIGPEFASHYPEISSGDVMVCLRNLNLVAVINPESGKMVWATTGPWEHPHDPDPLANGNILIFDNFVANGAEQGSAVVEFDPRTRKVAWQYLGSGDRLLASQTRSCQQLLANDNILINEADHGRILEVDRQGRTVWEYVHPLRAGEQRELIPAVFGARRYTSEEIPFVESLPQRSRPPVPSRDIAAVISGQ